MRPFVLFSLVALAACGSHESTAPANDNPYGITATGPGVFTVLPLDSSTLVSGTPLGYLAPPGHVLPTDHVYLNFVDPWSGSPTPPDCSPRPVRAIGSGVIDFVLQTESTGDLKVEVLMTRTFRYYYDHILLKPGVRVGTRVQVGDTIGTTTGRCPSMDLGVVDDDAPVPGRLVPARYGASLHVASPYRYFIEPLRSWLRARVRTIDGRPIDPDGKTDYGVAGRLSGDWFHTSIATSASELVNGPAGWPKSVSFTYDWTDGTPRISIGGTLTEAGVLKIAATDPDPRTVDQSRGLVIFRGTPVMGRIGAGWVLAQLLSESRVRLEYVPATQPTPTAFSAAAQEYVR
ncbi:MAG: M23 family metallopeptidase [Gemmatimonadaceae bacterium]|nr:M23 family metallopeptidase [Gemmatimonadaceae bacterium]